MKRALYLLLLLVVAFVTYPYWVHELFSQEAEERAQKRIRDMEWRRRRRYLDTEGD